MPRKPFKKKERVTIVVDGVPVAVTLHPAGRGARNPDLTQIVEITPKATLPSLSRPGFLGSFWHEEGPLGQPGGRRAQKSS